MHKAQNHKQAFCWDKDVILGSCAIHLKMHWVGFFFPIKHSKMRILDLVEWKCWKMQYFTFLLGYAHIHCFIGLESTWCTTKARKISLLEILCIVECLNVQWIAVGLVHKGMNYGCSQVHCLNTVVLKYNQHMQSHCEWCKTHRSATGILHAFQMRKLIYPCSVWLASNMHYRDEEHFCKPLFSKHARWLSLSAVGSKK